MRRVMCRLLLALVASSCLVPCRAADPWLTVAGGEGPGKGKRVVLVSGDEEYRSEEVLTQLAKILATRHGFECTVLYAIDPKTGEISPNTNDNIPGTPCTMPGASGESSIVPSAGWAASRSRRPGATRPVSRQGHRAGGATRPLPSDPPRGQRHEPIIGTSCSPTRCGESA